MGKARRQFKIFIDEDFCKGCNICVELCNLDVFDISEQINNKGYYVPIPARLDNCNGCQICELSCPELSVILVDSQQSSVDSRLSTSLVNSRQSTVVSQ